MIYKTKKSAIIIVFNGKEGGGEAKEEGGHDEKNKRTIGIMCFATCHVSNDKK